jgi:peptidase E
MGSNAMKNNIKIFLLAAVSGIMLIASSAGAHCKFPKANAECMGKKIDKNGYCMKSMKKGGTYKK